MLNVSGLAWLVQLLDASQCAELSAHISGNGVHGTISFNKEPAGRVHISARLDTQSTWSWAIHQLPVDYTQLDNRCHFRKLGPM